MALGLPGVRRMTRRTAPAFPGPPIAGAPLARVRSDATREHILSVLRLVGGRRTEAARILGISRKTLWKKLRQLGITDDRVTGR
jgi:DNA-binding NtrC family response regulator